MILEAVSLVNDCPLGPDANWDRDGISNLSHVSPNKLVHGRSSKIVPTNMTLKETIEQGMNVGLLYRHCKKVLNLFWNEFKANYLSRTVRARQPERESPKFQKPQISSSGVATAWGHAIELKSLVRICSFAQNQRN